MFDFYLLGIDLLKIVHAKTLGFEIYMTCFQLNIQNVLRHYYKKSA